MSGPMCGIKLLNERGWSRYCKDPGPRFTLSVIRDYAIFTCAEYFHLKTPCVRHN